MTCPNCRSTDTCVDSELHSVGGEVTRVYACGECGVDFVTVERVNFTFDDDEYEGEGAA